MTTSRHVIFGSGAIVPATLDAPRRRGETVPLVNSENATDLVVPTELVESGKSSPSTPAASTAQSGGARHDREPNPYPGRVDATLDRSVAARVWQMSADQVGPAAAG